MSSLIKPPPPMINIGGAPGAFPLPRPTGPMPGGPPGLAGGPPAPGGPGAGPGDNGPGDPDSGSVTDKLRKAMDLVQSAAAQEKDDVDASSLTAIVASLHKAIAAEQGLQDKAMGAGPGVKLIRKAGGSV